MDSSNTYKFACMNPQKGKVHSLLYVYKKILYLERTPHNTKCSMFMQDMTNLQLRDTLTIFLWLPAGQMHSGAFLSTLSSGVQVACLGRRLLRLLSTSRRNRATQEASRSTLYSSRTFTLRCRSVNTSDAPKLLYKATKLTPMHNKHKKYAQARLGGALALATCGPNAPLGTATLGAVIPLISQTHNKLKWGLLQDTREFDSCPRCVILFYLWCIRCEVHYSSITVKILHGFVGMTAVHSRTLTFWCFVLSRGRRYCDRKDCDTLCSALVARLAARFCRSTSTPCAQAQLQRTIHVFQLLQNVFRLEFLGI